MRRVGDVVYNAGNVHKGLDGFGVVYYTAVQYTDCKKPLAGTLTNDMIFLLLSRRERERLRRYAEEQAIETIPKRAAHTLSLWSWDAIFQAIGEKKKKTPGDI